jgi:hypothetical protein
MLEMIHDIVVDFPISSETKLSHNGQLAVQLAKLGLVVFPGKNRPGDKKEHKKPLVNWGSQATKDVPAIMEWWSKPPPWRDALPLIGTGPSGLLVLDPDRHADEAGAVKYDGVTLLDELFKQHGGWPTTPMVRTPTGGLHVYFRDWQDAPHGNSRGRLPKGIDVKAFGGTYGGYVVAPGAMLTDGRTYEQVAGTPDFFESIQKGAIPLVPQWLSEMLEKARPSNAVDLNMSLPPPGVTSGLVKVNAVEALKIVCADLAATSTYRGTVTYKHAITMGEWAALGAIPREVVSGAFVEAAKTNDHLRDDPDDFERSFDRGFRTGYLQAQGKVMRELPADTVDLSARVEALALAAGQSQLEPQPGTAYIREQSISMELDKLKWYDGNEQVPAPPWLIKNLLPDTGVALLPGQWGTGKTFIALDLATSVMVGTKFANYRCKRLGGVLYIAAEGSSQIAIRLRAIMDQKFPLHRRPVPFAWLDYCPPFAPKPGEFSLRQFAQGVAKCMQAKYSVPLLLIIIDTLAAAARFKDENAASEVQQAMDVLNAVSRAAGALVLAVDHFGKMADTGTRGSSAKEASADAVIASLGERSQEGVLRNTRIAVRKLRAGPTGAETAFTLMPIDMGLDEDGDRVTTCTINWSPVTVPAAPETAKGKGDMWPTPAAGLFRSVLMAILGQHGSDQQPYPDRPAVRAVELDKVRQEFNVRDPAVDRKEVENRRKRFERAYKAARDSGRIEIREINGTPFIWLTMTAPTTTPSPMDQGDTRPDSRTPP